MSVSRTVTFVRKIKGTAFHRRWAISVNKLDLLNLVNKIMLLTKKYNKTLSWASEWQSGTKNKDSYIVLPAWYKICYL